MRHAWTMTGHHGGRSGTCGSSVGIQVGGRFSVNWAAGWCMNIVVLTKSFPRIGQLPPGPLTESTEHRRPVTAAGVLLQVRCMEKGKR